jgi:hypothetical protein
MAEDSSSSPLVPLVPTTADAPAGQKLPSPRRPLLSEHSEFLQGEEPAAAKVEAFLSQTLAATSGPHLAARALVPWMCDVLLSKHSMKAYGRDLVDFVRHMEAQGVDPLCITADHVKL